MKPFYSLTRSIVVLTFFVALSHRLIAQNPTSPLIELQTVYSGLSSPVGVYNAGDNRLFILEQSSGDIEIIDTNGTYIGKFLDVTGLISTGGERGLLGLAFHPDYSTNGYFYINYTNLSGHTVVARYTVSANPNVANSGSAFIITTINQPYSNHNGGHITFGPDGYLYIGMGDGGSGGDPQNYSQNPLSKLGKMLRLDVNNGSPYGIPPDNPYFGQADTLPEIWSMGLRNPWKFSFDRETGDIWIGDVGQNAWEEINFEPASSTGKYNWGWRCYEGLHTYNTSGCQDDDFYDFPVKEYSHGSPYDFCSITGGMVYRGEQYPGLTGYYFFSDYCNGGMYALYPNGAGGFTEHLADAGEGFGLVAFGEDSSGELYAVNNGGEIYKLADECGSFDPAIMSDGNGNLVATAGGVQYWWWNNGVMITSTGTNNIYSPDANGSWYATVNNGTCVRQSNTISWLVEEGVPGCTYATALNYDPNAEVDDGSCIFPIPGCMDPQAANYNQAANIDDGSCEYGTYGCLEPIACNYDDNATLHDCTLCDFDSCVGCTSPCADNYDPLATIDDGSCTGCADECTADLNGDDIINTGDLLLFIGAFGTICE